MSRRSTPPKYARHSSGQARVRIDGKVHYLGPYGSPESYHEYAKLIADWQAKQAEAPTQLTVGQLSLLFIRRSEVHHRKGEKTTSQVGIHRLALKRLNSSHRTKLAAEFGPRDYKAVRESMVGEGLSRVTINQYCSSIRQMYRWAVSEEFVPVTVLMALKSVPDLRRGRSNARETEPIRPIAEAEINAVFPFVSRQVRDMIRLQMLCGCRPDEIVTLRPCDVNRDGDVWEYVPQSHKTEHHGKQRRIYFGPRAQAILGPRLDDRPADVACFSPAEAEVERRVKQAIERKSNVPPSQVRRAEERRRIATHRQRPPRDFYDVNSYRRAIHRGCDLAKIPRWSPNRLRHSRATDLRRSYGIEAAKTVCGHSNIETTLVYAEMDFARARAIMAEVG